MQCKDIELVLEQEGLEPLPEEARAHLAECRDCRSYVADLTSLVDVARKLPSEITPPDRVWISLRAQLVEEGIIKIPAEATRAEAAPFWESIGDFFRSRALATAMIGIIIVAATVFQVRRSRTAPVAPPAQRATAEFAPDVQNAAVPEPSEGFDRAARDGSARPLRAGRRQDFDEPGPGLIDHQLVQPECRRVLPGLLREYFRQVRCCAHEGSQRIDGAGRL